MTVVKTDGGDGTILHCCCIRREQPADAWCASGLQVRRLLWKYFVETVETVQVTPFRRTLVSSP